MNSLTCFLCELTSFFTSALAVDCWYSEVWIYDEVIYYSSTDLNIIIIYFYTMSSYTEICTSVAFAVLPGILKVSGAAEPCNVDQEIGSHNNFAFIRSKPAVSPEGPT